MLPLHSGGKIRLAHSGGAPTDDESLGCSVPPFGSDGGWSCRCRRCCRFVTLLISSVTNRDDTGVGV
eukprot:SAG25_NODE_9611_length_365_cov_1.338346_2_plen_66_part_01